MKNEQNELYVKSQERWFKEQELLIEMLEENKRNSENLISIHSRTLEVAKESLNHELNTLERTKELFEQWKSENIDLNDLKQQQKQAKEQ